MRECSRVCAGEEDTAGRGAQFEFGLASVFTAASQTRVKLSLAQQCCTRPLKGVDVSRGRGTAFIRSCTGIAMYRLVLIAAAGALL